MPLLQPRKPAERDILPWWHPHLLLRMAWNLLFSAGLGAAIGTMAAELSAQVAAGTLGRLGIGSRDWQDWAAVLQPLGWAFGCLIAFVSYMSYRMDDKTDA
ncbi:hypothetical protein [Ferrovibrio sp.]|uniref:hypothetical protein n=1 Tax=Ferrovibrio sp. TaxID=1917215 RepID=UPI0035186270